MTIGTDKINKRILARIPPEEIAGTRAQIIEKMVRVKLRITGDGSIRYVRGVVKEFGYDINFPIRNLCIKLDNRCHSNIFIKDIEILED